MAIFNPAKWVLTNSRLKFDDDFVVQGMPFQLMSLGEENREAIKLLKTSKAIIELAANGGFAIDRKRVIEDEALVDSLALMWEQDAVLAFTDPTIMYQVGERVCELSGFTPLLDEILLDEEFEKEEQAKAKEIAHDLALIDYDLKESACDGDTATPVIDLGQLQSDADNHYAQG